MGDQDLVARLRARYIQTIGPHGFPGQDPDEDCWTAASRIESLTAELARAKDEQREADAKDFDMEANLRIIVGSAVGLFTTDYERQSTEVKQERHDLLGEVARERFRLFAIAIRSGKSSSSAPDELASLRKKVERLEKALTEIRDRKTEGGEGDEAMAEMPEWSVEVARQIARSALSPRMVPAQ